MWPLYGVLAYSHITGIPMHYCENYKAITVLFFTIFDHRMSLNRRRRFVPLRWLRYIFTVDMLLFWLNIATTLNKYQSWKHLSHLRENKTNLQHKLSLNRRRRLRDKWRRLRDSWRRLRDKTVILNSIGLMAYLLRNLCMHTNLRIYRPTSYNV